MPYFVFIRHGETNILGRQITGRQSGFHLNERGREQARELAGILSQFPVRRIFSSPLERTRETAAPLAHKLHLEIEISEAFHEIDFGEWTGKNFAELEDNPQWQLFNTRRSAVKIPGGESITGVEERVIFQINKIISEQPQGLIAIFSHGDVIKLALLHYLGMHPDNMLRLNIAPASISLVNIFDSGAEILCLNHYPSLQNALTEIIGEVHAET